MGKQLLLCTRQTAEHSRVTTLQMGAEMKHAHTHARTLHAALLLDSSYDDAHVLHMFLTRFANLVFTCLSFRFFAVLFLAAI